MSVTNTLERGCQTTNASSNDDHVDSCRRYTFDIVLECRCRIMQAAVSLASLDVLVEVAHGDDVQ